MTRLENAAVMYADMTKKRTFDDDPHDFKKQLASNMTWEGVMLGGSWMLENAVRWLNDNAKNFSENADELIRQFEDAMEE